MENIKQWYQSEYHSDELGNEINSLANFKDLENNIHNVYEYLGVCDSIVRECVFTELANRLNLAYWDIYNQWLICD